MWESPMGFASNEQIKVQRLLGLRALLEKTFFILLFVCSLLVIKKSPMMNFVVDDHGSQCSSRRHSALGVSTKGQAPSPPPLKSLEYPDYSQRFPRYPDLTMDQKENLTDEELSLIVVLPGGVEKMTTVHGSKPLMDLLVMLCAKYHLSPSSHTLELVTANRNHVKFKPNAQIGTLEAERILLKPKGAEEKNKKAVPQMPEATVRMVINYNKTQKTILRVNPRVPLAELLPAICVKCEFDTETTVLHRDVQSQGALDLSNSLNDYAIREVYARDTKDGLDSPVCPASPSQSGTVTPGKDKNQKEKENKGLFSMFRKSKKKAEQAMTASAPASPVLVSKPRPLSMALPSTNSSPFSSPTAPLDMPKKRRAPQPPTLLSQSCPSELGARPRLTSEPGALEGPRMSGLSRGSSTESSLKRTKRKAPPPPTSLVVVQDNASLDGSQDTDSSVEGSTANNTLDEITEQEEATASVISATLSDTQGDDSSLNLSPDVSMDTRCLDTERLSPPPDGSCEDHLGDLSTDGKSTQSTVNDHAVDTDTMPAAEVKSSELAHIEGGQSIEVTQQLGCDGSTGDSFKGEASVEGHSPPRTHVGPDVCKAEPSSVSARDDVETPGEVAEGSETPPRPSGEDAQVQRDFTPLPEPTERCEEEPPSAKPLASGSSWLKRDMATLTEELNPPDLKPFLSHTEDSPSADTSSPTAPAPSKATSIYATDAEPKPKPANEVTRDYIPKVGMTTYTIVPQKSLEKLRYFEVELTLEAPPGAPEQETDIVSFQAEGSAAQKEVEDVSATQETELQSSSPREDSQMSSNATAHNTVNGTPTDSPPLPLTTNSFLEEEEEEEEEEEDNATAEVKEIKIPPTTKPKPNSFRLPQHKKAPGYYITSAAVKRLSAIPGAGHGEAPSSLERAKLPPPPLPPPMQCQEATTGGSVVEPNDEEVDNENIRMHSLTRQSSLPSKEPTLGLSLEKLRSFAAPRPFSPTTPSRFAQAVSSAVRRSQSLSHGATSPTSPVSPQFSPITGRFSIKESKGFTKSKESDNRQVDQDKGAALHEGLDGPLSHRGMAHMGGEKSPQQCPIPEK